MSKIADVIFNCMISRMEKGDGTVRDDLFGQCKFETDIELAKIFQGCKTTDCVRKSTELRLSVPEQRFYAGIKSGKGVSVGSIQFEWKKQVDKRMRYYQLKNTSSTDPRIVRMNKDDLVDRAMRKYPKTHLHILEECVSEDDFIEYRCICHYEAEPN